MGWGWRCFVFKGKQRALFMYTVYTTYWLNARMNFKMVINSAAHTMASFPERNVMFDIIINIFIEHVFQNFVYLMLMYMYVNFVINLSPQSYYLVCVECCRLYAREWAHNWWNNIFYVMLLLHFCQPREHVHFVWKKKKKIFIRIS